MADDPKPSGPDLTLGLAQSEFADGKKLLGHVGDEDVLLVRRGTEYFAVGAQCTHYHGPLVEGLIVGDSIRCPWHHARFDLRTGEALEAPAFDSLSCWAVEFREGKIFVRSKQDRPKPSRRGRITRSSPDKIVIIGGGAAGFAAAERLRREGFDRSLVTVSSDESPPYDRPNLSKDYLAGTASEDWLPMRPDSFYQAQNIDLKLEANVNAIDVRSREVVLDDGSRLAFDRLLLATGSEPVRPSIPGADQPQVHTLRSLKDCRAIIEATKTARRVVIFGASFIGLEVAASLRARGLDVHVVAPDERPMERILGPEMGDFVRALHEEHGVVFHLENTATAIDDKHIMLKSGDVLDADLIVAGIGVRPRIGLAEKAGLTLDRGVVVDEFLETSASGIFAAGDIVRWPDLHSRERIRVEHWVVAERQGQTAALNMLGHHAKFTGVPYFWSQHYDTSINYVGHAERWDEVAIEGSIPGKDCVLRYKRQGRILAVASINRDIESLRAHAAMEPVT